MVEIVGMGSTRRDNFVLIEEAIWLPRDFGHHRLNPPPKSPVSTLKSKTDFSYMMLSPFKFNQGESLLED